MADFDPDLVRVKICRGCGEMMWHEHEKCERCEYAFQGDEEGAIDRSRRLDVEPALPSEQELQEHIELLKQTEAPQRYSWARVKWFLQERLAPGLITFVIAGVLFAFRQYVREHFGLFGLFVGVGGFCIVGVVLVIGGLVRLVRGPQMQSPEDTLNTFYAGGVLEANHGNAWECLTPGAKEQFGSVKEFEAYWEAIEGYLRDEAPALLGATFEDSAVRNMEMSGDAKWHMSHRFSAGKREVVERRGEVCVARYDFSVGQSKYCTVKSGLPHKEKSTTFRVVDGSLTIPQETALVRSGDYWYLTSGRLSLPAEQARGLAARLRRS